ncbi:hypothetical protein BDP81DRAFT_397286 [Colletotrichum phormii]|uniref:Biogenesis of lysosome-related organelles complex 1 subunit 1 n=1 Tax=Colletotrichum phormii TaxID=359342 RepID=A0AAI9ZKL6_9PEZI|nr:uncharacterized protein BDP81DRAFT_397286 [Colletotrichum phormii]KAK1633396.1 hypothetical protein BDP81DRAFT_397286 [Colletotrichum phormii]
MSQSQATQITSPPPAYSTPAYLAHDPNKSFLISTPKDKRRTSYTKEPVFHIQIQTGLKHAAIMFASISSSLSGRNAPPPPPTPSSSTTSTSQHPSISSASRAEHSQSSNTSVSASAAPQAHHHQHNFLGAAQHAPPAPASSAASASPPQQPLHQTLPSADQQHHISEARAAVVASIGNMLDGELQTRARMLHVNAAALDKQERDVVRATEALRKENDKLAKFSGDAARRVKELGNVQNWAEVLERDFLVLEETLRLLEWEWELERQ